MDSSLSPGPVMVISTPVGFRFKDFLCRVGCSLRFVVDGLVCIAVGLGACFFFAGSATKLPFGNSVFLVDRRTLVTYGLPYFVPTCTRAGTPRDEIRGCCRHLSSGRRSSCCMGALGTKRSAISLQLPQVVLCMGSSFGNSRVEGVLEFC